ncbi:Lateral organ boundary [Sesbania bispinosa]|nr:Lateral organ boundary [Sesbania bispinosa]
MAEPEPQGGGDHANSGSRRGKGPASKRATMSTPNQEASTAPCGACKFLRRKCGIGCIFAPHFGSDQGSARFAAVHKVFGASNVSKMLSSIPEEHRNEAVSTLSYEAQARISDPVYGCVSTILALQQQVATLQAEVGMMQTQVMMNTNRLACASALQSSQQQILQPAYSNNNSSASTANFMNLNTFNNPAAGGASVGGFDLTMGTTPSSHSLEPLRLSSLSQYDHEEEDEQESTIPSLFNRRQ